ncbi:MAG: cell surface protein SprA [Bacteroidales bacterium]|nr:cell surface protein SprA [Bacteroidales bacterium]MCF8397233.1 cell surface protein SprA [Bacteroidales bacterium]
MRRLNKYFKILFFISILVLFLGTNASIDNSLLNSPIAFNPPDSIPDTTASGLRYPLPNENIDPYSIPDTNALFLKDPPNFETVVEYDPISDQYIIKRKIGDFYYRDPIYMDRDEYREYDMDQSLKNYWRQRSITSGQDSRDGIIPDIHIKSKAFDKIFGGSTIDIRPQGSAELIFGVRSNRNDDPLRTLQQQRTTNFNFEEKIQMNVIAKIGEKIEFKTNYNTESQFEFENKLSLKYEGDEDDIIKLIEAGDVNLPLNTSLITGTQSLFGIKTKLQFGRTTVTGVFSQQESEKKTITVEGGAQTNEFFLTALDYEENRHFFIAQFFRDNYQQALEELPILNSAVNITKVEVWVTNIGPAVENNRNIVAFTDLGENKPYNPEIDPIHGNIFPSNTSNNLTQQLDTNKIRNINAVTNYLEGDPFGIGKSGYMVAGEDFEKVESARKLTSNEYTLNPKLGFISLNTNLNPDQTLAIAFQYQIIGDDKVYQVGEFSDQGIPSPDALMVKLLKSTTVNTENPIWDLMMKNVYNLGAYQINRQDFILNIFYSGNENGVPTAYFTEGPENIKGVPLIRLMNFDNLDPQQNPYPDGFFDFINGAATGAGTIQASNGRVYFSVLEPFGQYLRNLFGSDTALASRYAFDSLYTLTKAGAEQFPDKNKYTIEGFYKSSVSNEISLNAFNIPRGSVTVTAGGRQLTENVDYTVDYTLGRVRIINDGILNSGTPINISMENNALFSIQTKRLMGLHFDHYLNEKFTFGGTILNLTERPITQKTNYGDDPISNTIWGLNFNYETESRWLTKMVDKIPLIETKAISRIEIEGEFAHFLPGHSRAIGKTGTAYIDDFEGAQSTIDIKNIATWFMASTPQGQIDLFPEAIGSSGLNYGKNRAKMAWYIIDPLFYDRNAGNRPNIPDSILNKNSVRQVLQQELFPNKDIEQGRSTNVPVFNLAYYPAERGPNNYDVDPVPNISAGIDQEGNLKDPESRWAGIMRRIETSDFEAANIEYIEFWMMDPFTKDSSNSGELYFNLGDISEDILKDSRKSFENGLPTGPEVTNVDTTIWGRIPTIQALVETFDDDPDSRPYQDVGYDGLSDDDERSFFTEHPTDYDFLVYMEEKYLDGEITQEAYEAAVADPSADNYHFFLGSDYDADPRYNSILERYKNFNNTDGNSPAAEQNPESYPIAATQLPNIEDINRDNTLSEAERYFQYKIELDKDKLRVGYNHVADIEERTYTDQTGEAHQVKWYQFKIPIQNPDKVIGNISDFRSIRFMRVFMRGFEKPIVCRLGTFELVRGEWRRYQYSLLEPGEYIPGSQQEVTQFDVTRLNVEENGDRSPIKYVIPPGIEREINAATTSYIRQNEQSLVLKIKDLADGDARAIFKTTDFDFRQYKKLKMFVHAEKMFREEELERGDLTAFIRIGSDMTENYYEYEIPLTFSEWFNDDVFNIWPEANIFDITLDELVQIKQNRNVKMRESGSGISTNQPYIEYLGDHKISILGVPSISDVKTIMIGVRNPKRRSLQDEDSGEPLSAEIWVNELRLTDFNKKGGWAASARMTANLADLGRITLSGSHSSAGFGSLDQQLTEVSLDRITEFGISTDLELGKFLPEESGVKVPMHFDYSETHVSPEYNPLDPDVKLQEEIDSYDTEEEKDSIKKITREYVQRKSINFINVRKDRTKAQAKPQVYDIENFNFSYSYSEIYMRNIDVEFDIQKNYMGGIGYNFSTQPQNVQPLSNVKFLQGSYLQLIRDFNFSYLPKQLTFRTEMNRMINEKKLRNKSRGLVKLETYVMKNWDWNRNYGLKWDLTQSLNLDFQAGAQAYIDEPQGLPDKGTDEYKMYRDSIVDEIFRLGSLDKYQQMTSLNYRVPIDKIPLLDWITLTSRYQADYFWNASPKSIRDRVGNSIEVSNTIQLNGDFNLESLYNKVPYFKRLNQKGDKGRGRGRQGISQLQSRRSAQQDNQSEEEQQAADTTDQKPKKNYFKIVGEEFLKILMGLKKSSFSYSQTNGTFLPGFIPEPTALGANWNYSPDTAMFSNTAYFKDNVPSSIAPGIGFVFGQQKGLIDDAIKYGWISPDSLVTQSFATKFSDNFNFRASIEPIPDLRIEITADRAYSRTTESYLRTDSLGEFRKYSPMEKGSFSMSYLSIGTAFSKDGANNISSVFETFKEYRRDIAFDLAGRNPNWQANPQTFNDTVVINGKTEVVTYPVGYGPKAQEVMHYAFLAAYSGRGPDKTKLERFPVIPLPNWRLTYTGLTKIEFLKEYFRKISISHAYRSSYSIGGFTQYTEYKEKDGYPSTLFPNGNNYIPKYDIAAVSIMEQFAPLFGIDVTMNNNVSSRVEYKKSRNLTFSFVNNQLTEVQTNEFILGLGYKIKDVSFSFITQGGSGGGTRVRSDLDLRADFSIRSNKTILRRVDEDINQVSAGQKVISINTTADYQINQRFNIRLFFDKVINNPFVSNQYRNSTTNAGLSIRFTLNQ